MKIILTGAAGLLGHDVWRLFEHKHELIAIGRTQAPWIGADRFRSCDLSNAALTYSIITKENPDLVVHCAGYNNVDGAESDYEAAFKANALATRNIALGCQRFDATLISISTDYVFDGQSALATGYREFDPCHPINLYGQSKLWAETFVQQLLTKYFIVRTSWLFGLSRQTWIDRVLQSAQAGQDIHAASDMVSAPTYTRDLAEALLKLAESRHYGLYHVTNAGFGSRVALAEEVLSIHKLNRSQLIKPMTLSALKLPARRPTFSGMDNLAWRLDGFTPLRPWKDALREYFNHKKVVTP